MITRLVCRYVERNALRAKLAFKAEHWRWSSLWHRVHGSASLLLDTGPLELPKGWVKRVNKPETDAEIGAFRQCIVRGRPFADPAWQGRTAKRLGLALTLRPRARPRKKKTE